MQLSGLTPPETGDELALFLQSLAEHGRPVVSPKPLGEEDGEALTILSQVDTHARAELALEAPAFSPASALWAARLFYHLCQFTVCRDLSEERIASRCALVCPEPRQPETDWSADLVLRHLPGLFQLARHLSNADPLVQQMKQIAVAWPLSSVGMAGLEALRPLHSFIDHPALRRLYLDRILAHADTARLGDTLVDNLLRADLGVHHELAPVIAKELTHHDTH